MILPKILVFNRVLGEKRVIYPMPVSSEGTKVAPVAQESVLTAPLFPARIWVTEPEV